MSLPGSLPGDRLRSACSDVFSGAPEYPVLQEHTLNHSKGASLVSGRRYSLLTSRTGIGLFVFCDCSLGPWAR